MYVCMYLCMYLFTFIISLQLQTLLSNERLYLRENTKETHKIKSKSCWWRKVEVVGDGGGWWWWVMDGGVDNINAKSALIKLGVEV